MNIAALIMTNSVSPSDMKINLESLKLLYITGAPYDAVHAIGASVCVFLFSDNVIRKIERVKIKYGIYRWVYIREKGDYEGDEWILIFNYAFKLAFPSSSIFLTSLRDDKKTRLRSFFIWVLTKYEHYFQTVCVKWIIKN